jgi:hypothetical protein
VWEQNPLVGNKCGKTVTKTRALKPHARESMPLNTAIRALKPHARESMPLNTAIRALKPHARESMPLNTAIRSLKPKVATGAWPNTPTAVYLQNDSRTEGGWRHSKAGPHVPTGPYRRFIPRTRTKKTKTSRVRDSSARTHMKRQNALSS